MVATDRSSVAASGEARLTRYGVCTNTGIPRAAQVSRKHASCSGSPGDAFQARELPVKTWPASAPTWPAQSRPLATPPLSWAPTRPLRLEDIQRDGTAPGQLAVRGRVLAGHPVAGGAGDRDPLHLEPERGEHGLGLVVRAPGDVGDVDRLLPLGHGQRDLVAPVHLRAGRRVLRQHRTDRGGVVVPV